MNDFAPPSGPPPPHAPEVPAGWAARWNDQYKEWFYVNVYTKQSQWERPTAPVFPIGEDARDPPPGYEPGHTPALTDTKKNPYEAPVATGNHSSSMMDEDAKLAAKLQAEEDAMARSHQGGPQPPTGYGAGAAASYQQQQQGGGGGNPYAPSSGSPYPQSGSPYPQGYNTRPQEQYPQDLPSRDKGKGGFLGKLFGGKGKTPMGGGGFGGYAPQPQQQQGYYQSPPPQPQYGGFQTQGAGYGGGYGGAGGGGYGGQAGYMQRPQKKPGMGGMGMGLAGGALGLGAGVLGGAMIADAVHDHHEHEEQEAYMDGYQDAQNDDFGGGDDFGGDFGGDF